MSEAMVITAGRAGGDFDGFIDYVGRPIAFGYGSHTARQVIMVEGRGDTGQTVEMVRIGEGLTRELRLRDADGHLLADFSFQTLAFNLLIPKASADQVLDYMMDKIQSGVFGGPSTGFRFVGNVGADRFTGGGDADWLTGAAGNDMLAGAGGADSLAGGQGNDTLAGGNGADRMSGGGGADVFVFAGSADLARGDKITDFSVTQGDRIDLRGVDAMTGNLGLDHFTLISTDFTGQKGELRIRLTGTDAFVLGDADGDGLVDFGVTLLGVTALDATALLLA